MRKLVVTEFMSLDGVFEAPGPDGSGYKYEGWTFAYNDKEFGTFKMNELRVTDMLLLGRVTYDGFAIAWPKMSGDEFSDKFNSMPKYVVSKTLQKTEWQNSYIIKDNILKEIQKLKDQEGGDITVHGSGQLVQYLTEHKLVDQFNLMVYPVVLGEGKRLFSGASKVDLQLMDFKTFSSGIVFLMYEPRKDVEK